MTTGAAAIRGPFPGYGVNDGKLSLCYVVEVQRFRHMLLCRNSLTDRIADKGTF